MIQLDRIYYLRIIKLIILRIVLQFKKDNYKKEKL